MVEPTPYHLHNGTDSPRLDAKRAIANSPQPPLTTAVATAFTTGGAAILSASDSAILDNMRIRINDLETKLRKLGLVR